ncbi:MAG: hypothetical protein ACXU8U_05990 [Asticcacaulis sp.]
MIEILTALGTTLLGVILSQIVARWDSWHQIANRSDLRGEWLSASFAVGHNIVYDTVTISKKWGKLYLKNKENSYGYMYDASCIVENNNILSGAWRSTRRGSITKGRMIMIVDPQGTSMFGVFSGKAKDTKDVILGWAMARDHKELDLAVQAMKKSIVAYKRNSRSPG